MITPIQEQVLALISAGSTISTAAGSVGIHRNTVHNWMRSAPQFRIALARAGEAKAIYWREHAEELTVSALDTVRALMTDPAVPASVRLKAAQFILGIATVPPVQSLPLEAVYEGSNRAGTYPTDSTAEPYDSLPLHNSAQPAPPAVPLELPPPYPETPQFVHNSAQAFHRDGPKIGRNEACPCGSGKKFKRCCLGVPAAIAS